MSNQPTCLTITPFLLLLTAFPVQADPPTFGSPCTDSKPCQAPGVCYNEICQDPCVFSSFCELSGDCALLSDVEWSTEGAGWVGAEGRKLPFGCLTGHRKAPESTAPIQTRDPSDLMGCCVPSRNLHCEASRGCERRGKCHLDPHGKKPACIQGPIDEAWCKASKHCRDRGLCGLGEDGRCVASSDEDCASSKHCTGQGKCIQRDGACTRSAEGCASSRVCTHHGGCGFANDRCVPTKPAHCLNSKHCQRTGNCDLKDGMCQVATDVACGKTTACKLRGACLYAPNAPHPEPSQGPIGISLHPPCAASTATCEAATKANKEGFHLVPGHVNAALLGLPAGFSQLTMCVLDPATDCTSTRGCKRKGKCSYRKETGTCEVLSSADCLKSERMVQRGRIVAERMTRTTFIVPGGPREQLYTRICEKPEGGAGDRPLGPDSAPPEGLAEECQKERSCGSRGDCSAVYSTAVNDWLCGPTLPEHCANASYTCKDEGQCSLVDHAGRPEASGSGRRFQCEATTDAMCRASTDCSKLGHCAFDRGSCLKGSTTDCARSKACLDHGKSCKHNPASGQCFDGVKFLD